MPPAKSTSVSADANVPCSQSPSTGDSVEQMTEQSTCSVDRNAADVKTDDIESPPSLVDLATQCVSSGGTVKCRAWADSPMEPTAPHASGGPCYELDPTPQEAAAAAASAAASALRKPVSSDSGGEDSAKENKETPTERSGSGKGSKKKGL